MSRALYKKRFTRIILLLRPVSYIFRTSLKFWFKRLTKFGKYSENSIGDVRSVVKYITSSVNGRTFSVINNFDLD